MDRRNLVCLSAVLAIGLALFSVNAIGQQKADEDGAKAASKAFYEALSVLVNGEAMEKVWAHNELRHLRWPSCERNHRRLGFSRNNIGLILTNYSRFESPF